MELYRSSAPYACVRKNIPMPQKKARVERCRKNLLVHFPNFLFSSVLLLVIQCSCCTGPSLYTQLHLIHPIRPTSTTVLDRLLNQHDGVNSSSASSAAGNKSRVFGTNRFGQDYAHQRYTRSGEQRGRALPRRPASSWAPRRVCRCELHDLRDNRGPRSTDRRDSVHLH